MRWDGASPPALRLEPRVRLPSRLVSLCWATMLPARDIVVVHSSDLHMDHDYTARLHGGDGTAGLASVLSAARAACADIVVLAGDTFDCHRVPPVLLVRATAPISAGAVPVEVSPCIKAPAVTDTVYPHETWTSLEILPA